MKSNLRLRIRNDARADLREIRRYTLRKWGPHQRDRYSTQLSHALNLLLEFPERGRTRNEDFDGCRSLSVGEHFVFYELIDDEVVVLRIFSTPAKMQPV